MAKQIWKPGNMIYPVPAVLVSMRGPDGRDNLVTVAWTGTVCTNPAMAYISLRPSRFSYGLIQESGEFAINLTTEQLAFATDFCGVRSGREVDKAAETGLKPVMDGEHIYFEQAKLVFLCKKIYRDTIRPEGFLADYISDSYPEKDYHDIYMGEILKAYIQK